MEKFNNMAQKCKLVRTKLKISQKKFAELIGSNQTAVCLIERGLIPVEQTAFVEITRLYNTFVTQGLIVDNTTENKPCPDKTDIKDTIKMKVDLETSQCKEKIDEIKVKLNELVEVVERLHKCGAKKRTINKLIKISCEVINID